MKVVLLSGGVGGARFARGLADVLQPGELTVIGNVGDDVEVLGLHVSPDLDSILYTLAGLNDEERGWGRAGETWRVLESAAAWGGEDWFRLGDLDIGLHLVRTQALRAGETLSTVTGRLVSAAGLAAAAAAGDRRRLRTLVHTPAGTFGFQEWFVGRGHRDEVDAVELRGRRGGAAGAGRRSTRSPRPTCCSWRPATRTSRSGRSSPSGRSGRRSSAGPSAASPSARSSAGGQSKAPPTVCSRAWPAGRNHAM